MVTQVNLYKFWHFVCHGKFTEFGVKQQPLPPFYVL